MKKKVKISLCIRSLIMALFCASTESVSTIQKRGWSGPEVIKLFFMLNSAEYENFSANKYENANNSWHFHIY